MGKVDTVDTRYKTRRGRKMLYLRVTLEEFQRITTLADREQVSQPNLLRRGLSELLVQNGLEPLCEMAPGRLSQETL